MSLSAIKMAANLAGKAVFVAESGSLATSESIFPNLPEKLPRNHASDKTTAQ
jgi:hypothetical protein